MTENIVSEFLSIGRRVVEKPEQFFFNLANLPEINEFKTDIRIAPFFEDIFTELDKKRENCIYWFSLENEKSAEKLNILFNSKREYLKANNRVVPPPNKNRVSKVFYVGIRRGGIRKRDGLTYISGRIIQHLGYYAKGSTQGLQLAHWTEKDDFKMVLNVVEFIGLPNEFLNVVEMIVAHELKPLCGKH